MPVRHEAWPAGTPCWIDLATSDPAAAQAFYAAVLGWDFGEPFEEFGGYVDASCRGEMVAGIGPTTSPGQPSAWTVYFAVDDIDTTVKAVIEAGGTTVLEPVDVNELGRMAVAVDPGGASFGLWQAGTFIGITRYNEPGALTWEEGWVRDLDASRDFYSAVLGLSFTAVPGMDGYETFATDGAELGGMAVTDGSPHWVGYFSVADVDASVATAVDLGATVVQPPVTTPNGRMAEIVDPQGATLKFSSIDLS